MKIMDLFAHFTEREWTLLRSKYSEIEIKQMLTKAMDSCIGVESEKIESTLTELVTHESTKTVA